MSFLLTILTLFILLQIVDTSAHFFYVIYIYIFRFFHASEIVGKKIVLHGGWNDSESLGT